MGPASDQSTLLKPSRFQIRSHGSQSLSTSLEPRRVDTMCRLARAQDLFLASPNPLGCGQRSPRADLQHTNIHWLTPCFCAIIWLDNNTPGWGIRKTSQMKCCQKLGCLVEPMYSFALRSGLRRFEHHIFWDVSPIRPKMTWTGASHF